MTSPTTNADAIREVIKRLTGSADIIGYGDVSLADEIAAALAQHAEAEAVAWAFEQDDGWGEFERRLSYSRRAGESPGCRNLRPLFPHPAQPASQQGEKVRGLVEKWRADAGEIGQKDAFDCGFARGHESCADELAAPTHPATAQEDGIRVPREIFNHPGLIAHLTTAFDCCEEYAQEYIWEPIIRAMLTSPDSGKGG